MTSPTKTKHNSTTLWIIQEKSERINKSEKYTIENEDVGVMEVDDDK